MTRVDYEAFRTKSWAERIEFFNTIAADERAVLVRTHIAQWLGLHRHELTVTQISIVEESLAFISAELYALPPDEALVRRFIDLAQRATMVLSREQARDAFTMYWNRACATAPPLPSAAQQKPT